MVQNVSRNVVISRKIETNKGKFTGSNTPYGYKVDNTNPPRKYIIDEGPAKIVWENLNIIARNSI